LRLDARGGVVDETAVFHEAEQLVGLRLRDLRVEIQLERIGLVVPVGAICLEGMVEQVIFIGVKANGNAGVGHHRDTARRAFSNGLVQTLIQGVIFLRFQIAVVQGCGGYEGRVKAVETAVKFIFRLKTSIPRAQSVLRPAFDEWIDNLGAIASLATFLCDHDGPYQPVKGCHISYFGLPSWHNRGSLDVLCVVAPNLELGGA